MKKHIVLGASGLAALTLLATGCAGSSSSSSSSAASAPASAPAAGGSAAASDSAAPAASTAPECAGTVAVMAPLTGGAASIGQEQLNFAKLAVDDFNTANGSMYKVMESDTQLDAGQASTQATSIASDTSIIGVVGPAGSQEVSAVGPTFKDAGIGYVSASATNPDLTNGSNPGFFRVVPTDAVQGPTDGDSKTALPLRVHKRTSLATRRIWEFLVLSVAP